MNENIDPDDIWINREVDFKNVEDLANQAKQTITFIR
jgi:hypothetical protein